MNSRKVDILGVGVSNYDMKEAIESLFQSVKNNDKKTVVTVNASAMTMALKDRKFFEVLNLSDIVLPDGIGIVWASRLLGNRMKERVSGPDFFLEFTKFANQREKNKVSYFFLGSTKDVLDKMKRRCLAEFPNIKMAGVYSPPFCDEFTEEENKRSIAAINKEKPDILWVGISAPKQEKWIHQNIDKMDIRGAVAVGYAFDVFAGVKKRVPLWVRKAGFEWLGKVFQEPKRLWKRYLIKTWIFVGYVLVELYQNIFMKKEHQ